MTNPTSTSRAPTRAGTTTTRDRSRRRGIARALPIGACLAACLLLAAAAVADGQAAPLVLAGWVALLVVAGLWMTVPRGPSVPRRPMLTLAEFDEDGQVGESRALPVQPTRAALRVLQARPRG
jgi:hypothetical protein